MRFELKLILLTAKADITINMYDLIDIIDVKLSGMDRLIHKWMTNHQLIKSTLLDDIKSIKNTINKYHNKYVICKSWKKYGKCKYGANCWYLHITNDINNSFNNINSNNNKLFNKNNNQKKRKKKKKKFLRKKINIFQNFQLLIMTIIIVMNNIIVKVNIMIVT